VPGQPVEQPEGGLAADARAPVAAQHEELGDVEVRRVVARRGAARREGEAGEGLAVADQEREAAVRLAPVGGQALVAEAAVGAHVERKCLAQVVQVELEQARERGLVATGGGLEPDIDGAHRAPPVNAVPRRTKQSGLPNGSDA
jgi:hypothetical protein